MPAQVNFKLPPPVKKRMWSLSDKECLFLDMTIFLPLPNWEIFRMVMAKDGATLTETLCKTRAAGVTTSMDGKEYLEYRLTQLNNYFYPDEGATKKEKVKIGPDGFPEGLTQKVMILMDDMLNKPNAEGFSDAFKLAFQKVSKDMDLSNLGEPPKRYLPEMCKECRYKVFCEGECLDECKICRYRKYANDNGVFYTHKDQLDKSLAEPEKPESRD